MKRKLSSTSSGESSLNGNDGDNSDRQVQQSGALALEQGTRSAGEEGFILDPHLAQMVGMHPGEKLFQSMFYGSPRASCISSLVDELLSKQEALLRRGQLGEGTSSSTQHDMSESLSLARYNARVIRALVSSIEAPASLIIGGGVGAMHGQAPGASHGQGPSASHWQDPGASHWQDPGASHWQAPGASHWQDPGASHWQDPGASHWQDPGASHWQDPGASHGQAPGASHWQDPGASHWQDPGASGRSTVPYTVVDSSSSTDSDSETGSEKRMLEKLEEERNQRLARSQARLEKERVEQGVVLALGRATLREKELREVKNRVGVGTRGPGIEIPPSLTEIDERLRAITEKKKALGSILGLTPSRSLQEMRRELDEVRARKIELDRVGAGESAVELGEVRARRIVMEEELRRATDRMKEAEALERETNELLTKEIELVATGASGEEIEEVRARQMEINSRLVESKAMIETARRRETELEQLITREREIERMVNIEERIVELDRLRIEARAGTSEEDIELALELEGARVRTTEIELELLIERELLMAEELKLIEVKEEEEMIALRKAREEASKEITIIIQESEEERANRLAALEAKMISDAEKRAMEKLATLEGEDEEEDEEKEKTKRKLLAKARRREEKKMDEVRSGKRVAIGSSIPEDIMKEIEARSAAIVKALTESKARENAAMKAIRIERERIKAAGKAAAESRKAEVKATKARLKAEAEAARERERERIRLLRQENEAAVKAEKERERKRIREEKAEVKAAAKKAKEELKAMKDRQREEALERIRALLEEKEREKEEEKDKQGKQ
ncbi:hypothetical protein [Candidatus Ichthyocystis sparus]|uniref:hypothetical protein n=1 Tax=Candidatus Ichthyocystis sparus TaxID=1561004 RepID=UPI000A5A9012|nr:hypothetical protein [Candidatus Ichthyocystis sparus]